MMVVDINININIKSTSLDLSRYYLACLQGYVPKTDWGAACLKNGSSVSFQNGHCATPLGKFVDFQAPAHRGATHRGKVST